MEKTFIKQHLNQLEDFWRRREASTTSHTTIHAYGYPVIFLTNHPGALEAVKISARRYARCASIPDAKPIRISLVMDQQFTDKQAPDDLPSRLRYIAVGDFITMNCEPWVNGFADLDKRVGVALFSKSLLKKPRLLSRFVVDTIVLNMLLRTGWGQLHASCVYHADKAVLLCAPNNVGKSTTAIRLVRDGYRLVSDGMIYVRKDGDGLELLGYPVGEIKLRNDQFDEFPDFIYHSEPTLVREDLKRVLDIRSSMPDRVIETGIRPHKTSILLMERDIEQEKTQLIPIHQDEAIEGVWKEALHLDDETRLVRNFVPIHALVYSSDCYRLKLGTDPTSLLRCISTLAA